MSRGAQLRVSNTRSIPKPNIYIEALYGECGAFCLDEQDAPKQRGTWRQSVFRSSPNHPLDLEIGTGNGYHFSHRAFSEPQRLLLGLELKYKPLIQSIRRCMRQNSTNARMARYNAVLTHELFAEGELNNVYIHFPDPWSKGRQHKHRLLQTEFLNRLWLAQKPGSFVEIKTDSRDYFEWALERIQESRYLLEAHSFDLHASPWAATNFVTQFESIFLREGIKINFALLRRD
ncbi:MAG: tRNA (guanosine(46)-N7)-methyltransferase TrmB [Bdellovibrionales bacterium]